MSRPTRLGLGAIGLAAALIVPAGSPALGARPAEIFDNRPVECPDTMATEDIVAGMTGTGWTVVRGTTPSPFEVEILGVEPDGLYNALDVILVRVSDADGEDFIERAGGIWAGMSGSPVYVEGKLIGAIGWGFSYGPSTFGGVTPIASMLTVAERPGMADAAPASTAMSAGLRRAIAENVPASAGKLVPLRLPLVASADRPVRVKKDAPATMKKFARRLSSDAGYRKAGFMPVKASPKPAGRVRPAGGMPALEAGGNFAASLSVGAVPLVGVGTATWVCGDRVLAFGHGMMGNGGVRYGAHNATAIDIVDDPTGTPYKYAVPGGLEGRVVQDRISAIGARTGAGPNGEVTVTSSIETPGGSHDGSETRIFVDDERLWWYPEIVSRHAITDLYRAQQTIDWNDGQASVEVTIRGTRENGDPFTIVTGDRGVASLGIHGEFWYVPSILSYLSAWPIWMVEGNTFETVSIESVDLDVVVGDTADLYLIEALHVSRNGGPYREVSSLGVRRGDRLDVRVRLADITGNRTSPAPSAERVTRTFSVVVPANGPIGDLEVSGRNGYPRYAYGPWDLEYELGFTSFDELAAWMEEEKRTDALTLHRIFPMLGTSKPAGEYTLDQQVFGPSFSVDLFLLP